MIKDYLNQTALWHYTTGQMNEYGEPQTSSKSIKVRWEGKRRLVRDNEGREVVSEARVFCVEPVQPGDLLKYADREWPVIAVSEATGIDGRIHFREVAL
jgi:hypothetical protein